MPRAIPVETVATGTTVTPHEINAELAELVGCANALDRDNFGGAELTHAKVHVLATGGIFFQGHASAGIQTVYAVGELRQFEQPVLDAAGEPWIEEVETGDCGLILESLITWEEMTNPTKVPPFLWLGMRVDGILVAKTPQSDRATVADHGLLEAIVPVSAGPHTVALVHGVNASGAAALTIEWHERWVMIREGAR